MKTQKQLINQIELMSHGQLCEFISQIVNARYGIFANGRWVLDQNQPEHKEMLMDIEGTIEQFSLNPDSL